MYTFYFIFTDINKKLKTNNYYLLYQLIKDKYGQFKQISNQSNSCIIFFEHMYEFLHRFSFIIQLIKFD